MKIPSIFLSVFFCCFAVLGQANDGKHPKNPPKDSEKAIRRLRQALRDARMRGDEGKMEKLQRLLRKFRKWRFHGNGKRPFFWGLEKSLLIRPPRLNLKDIAHYSIAQIYIQQKKSSQALAELQKVVKNSPDRATRSAAQFSMANIHLLNRNINKAISSYLKVEGPFRKKALLTALRLLRRVKDLKKLSRLFQNFLKFCKSPREKAMAHLMMASLYRKYKKYDQAILQLQAITKMNYKSLSRRGGKKSPFSRRKFHKKWNRQGGKNGFSKGSRRPFGPRGIHKNKSPKSLLAPKNKK